MTAIDTLSDQALSATDLAALDGIIDSHGAIPNRLLQILIEVQDDQRWLAPTVLRRIADRLGVSLARVRGVVGFYSFLHERPVGAYRVLFSDNVTDRMQGSENLLNDFCQALWVEPGKMSEDGLVSVDRTSCTGLCDQGPGLLVNGRAMPRATPERLEEIRELILERRPVSTWPDELFRIEDNVRRADLILDARLTPGDPIRAALARGGSTGPELSANERSWREGLPVARSGPMAMLAELERSNLRGRGGAGFHAAAKWAACAGAPAWSRVIVCNADEGEPGTFKDRVLLSRCPDLLFDGMTVAALTVGAELGFLYLRGEYAYLRKPLEAVLERRRRDGLLGENIAGNRGFDFDIEIHLGAGSYVCGEESALLESLEGNRGIPRNRPPYPVTNGYLDKPTVVNNVETLCAAGLIAVIGGEAYREVGTPQSSGTKILSVAGDCERPGIYEYPFGVTVAEVLADAGAGDPLAVQISGPSGTCVDPAEFQRKIAFEDLPTAGAVTVFDRSRDMFEVARAYTQFFAHESCGFCTPCRAGTSMLVNVLDKIHQGRGSLHELKELAQLNPVLQKSAHCGLGHTACNPVLDTLKRFRPAYERRLRRLRFAPDFNLDGALAAARRLTGRDDPGAHLEEES